MAEPGEARPLRILLVGLNFAPEPVGIGPYSDALARWLAERGHIVEVVTGKPYYPDWHVPDAYRGRLYRRDTGEPFGLVRCAHYVPAKPTSARRVVHHLSFAATAAGPTIATALRLRPDIVFAVAPSLIAAPVALAAARLSGAAAWLHVQDFEVETALATGLMAAGRVARTAAAIEAGLLRRFDRVSTISPQMGGRLAAKGVVAERIVEFRNWADTDTLRPLTAPSSYRSRWRITTPHVALYSGNLGNKQGIEILADVAARLEHRRDLTIIICGNGPSRHAIEAATAALGNVRVHDLQPNAALSDLLGLATVHLLPQLAGAADLVLPSKLTNMLASGRPVVATVDPGTGIAIELEGCGLIGPPGDARACAANIVRLLDDASLCERLGHAARRRAEERWSARRILPSVEAAMRRLVARRGAPSAALPYAAE